MASCGRSRPTIRLWLSSGYSFQMAQDLLFSLIWVVQRRATALRCSAARMTGMPPDQMFGQSFGGLGFFEMVAGQVLDGPGEIVGGAWRSGRCGPAGHIRELKAVSERCAGGLGFVVELDQRVLVAQGGVGQVCRRW